MNINIDNQQREDPPVGTVLLGDALTRLRRLPSGSVDTVVTSPPYFMLRNYGMPGQLGLEDSVDQWVAALLAVLAEVRRVLKPEGTLWLNLGDTYARSSRHGAEPKSLVLAPEKLGVAMTTDGWRLRNKIVWAKPNPLPASVRDRLTCTYEPLYLFSKARDYYFDLDAIRMPARSKLNGPSVAGGDTKYGVRGTKRPGWSGPLAGTNSGLEGMKARAVTSHPLGKNPGDVWTIPTASYRGAHFATFPEALVERPLLAGCPERTCRTCGIAWRRARTVRQLGSLALMGSLRKSCGCPDRAWQPGIVLDPFFGVGTVGVVAERLHRRWLGIELNNNYRRLAMQRIAAARTQTKGGGDGETTTRTRTAA